MVKVSFIVPIYNVEEYVAECIESMCSQKEEQVEIILVDDGSSDHSLEICNCYAKKDNRIKVIHQENQGANIARNKGLKEAVGEWVCFVDGDDYVEPDICTGLAEYMEQPYDIICYSYNKAANGKIRKVNSNAEKIIFEKDDFKKMQIATLNRLGNYPYNASALDTVSIWNKMYRRAFLQKNQLEFIPKMPKLQDLTFNLKVYDYAQSGIYVNLPLYNYRINQASVSHRYQKNIVEKFEIINQYLIDFVAQKEETIYKTALEERLATHLRTCIVLYFCNGENKESYKKRKKEFLSLREREPYATAMKQVDLKNFTWKETILSWAIKHKMFWVCEMLCRAYELKG